MLRAADLLPAADLICTAGIDGRDFTGRLGVAYQRGYCLRITLVIFKSALLDFSAAMQSALAEAAGAGDEAGGRGKEEENLCMGGWEGAQPPPAADAWRPTCIGAWTHARVRLASG